VQWFVKLGSMSGKEHEFVSVIQKSKVSKETYVILGCKKGGKSTNNTKTN